MPLGVLTCDPGSSLRVASARQDALDTVERWCLMVAQRCALPVLGYRWSADADWIDCGPLWAPCIHGDDRAPGTDAFVIVDAAAGDLAPVLMDAG